MKFALVAVLLLAGVATASAAGNFTALGSVQSCGSSSDLAQNLQLSLSPANPQPGQSYTYTSSYTLSQTVTGGTASYLVTLRGIPVSSKTDDLCTDLKSTDTPCPLEAGPITSTTTGTVPSDVPAGEFVSTTKWTDSNGNPILCVQITINVQ